MENNEINYLLSEKVKLENLLEEMRKRGVYSQVEHERYEEIKMELADILRRMNQAY